ncbi:SDR family oxidoreductase [Rhodovulum sp. FJ3]|uniref:SDR family oxidoreductase n=1 Tax=Rhodovulum sp. FJ3 TaxID=3079053 RepID=UPI00293DDC3E|nr:SDR family oxidoreductase [Rhodovulum sp. FJ3]MDV4169912.1 SDR family oxidoreductase [Rhodovulum sp. FJ3]
MHDLTDKVVVITGASRGIGAAAAVEMAKSGAKVALLARNRDAIDQIAAGIGDAAIAIACDVADADQVTVAFDQAVSHFGQIDVVINNAGIIDPIARLGDADADAWGTLIDVNLKGAFYGVQAALRHMPTGGTIITVSSGAASNPIAGWSAYCASKAGAAMLTRCLDLEYRDAGIRAFGLSPGTVATQMQKDIKASSVDNRVRQMDWSDHIPPEWPARALAWMCTPAADDLIGTEISLRDDDIRSRAGVYDA